MIPGTVHGPRRGSGKLLSIAVLIVLMGMGFLLTGCDASLVRTPRMSDAWSKGLPLGMASLNNRVALAADEAGGVYVVWVDVDRDLRFVHLDGQAGVLVEQALDLDYSRPQQPKIALDADDQVHLTWLDRRDRAGLQLFYARLSADGDVLQAATPLSMSEMQAGSTAMVLDPLGQTVEVFWSDTSASRTGLYHSAVDGSGNVAVPEELLVPDGFWPTAQLDLQGFVHIAWRTEREGEDIKFHYAVYDPQSQALGPQVEVGEPLVQISLIGGPTAAARFSGPWLGLDEDLVYLAWLMEVRERGGLSAFTFYQPFPQPDLDRSTGGLDYESPDVSGEVVHVRGVNPTLTGDPSFIAGQPADQTLAYYTEAQGPRNLVMLQSAAAALQAGQVASQEVVSATPGASMKPSVAMDGLGNLHLVWIDTAGFDRYRVTYASTAPEVHKVLDPVTVAEVVSQTLELGFGAVALLGFLPLYLMWALPAFLVLLVFFLATQEVHIEQQRARVALWAAVGVHIAVVLWTAGGAITRLSSGNLPTAPGIVFVVRWMLPLFISGLAVLVMVVYMRRKEHPGIFGCFFVFILAEAVLYSLLYLTPLLLLA